MTLRHRLPTFAALAILLLAASAGAQTLSTTAASVGGSNAYPEGDFYRQLSAASGAAADSCEWPWGCGGSPFRTGPGRCDNWKVGPRWEGSVDGLVLFRDGTNLDALIAAASAGGLPIDNDAATLRTDFDHGAGARAWLVGHYPQCRGYALRIGYLGLFDWNAGAFDPNIPAVDTVTTQRSLSYQSSLHSLEFDGEMLSDSPVRLFGGMRYARLGEDLDDVNSQSAPPPIAPGVTQTLVDITRSVSIDNHLIGFQGGVRGDLWSFGDRFFISGFANSGVYCNLIKRTSRVSQTNTNIEIDDPATVDVNEAIDSSSTTSNGFSSNRARVGFLSEAALSAVYQMNASTSARVGYQVVYLNGVELGDEAFIGAAPTSSDLLLHGWFAGVEYRR